MLKTQKFKFVKSVLLSAVLMMIIGCCMTVFAAESGVKEPILSKIEPKGVTAVYNGQKLTLRALAAKGASVSAKVNGTTISLSQTSSQDNGFYWYKGTYTVSGATAGAKLGKIEFTAVKGMSTEKKSSAGLVGAKISNAPTSPDDNDSSGNVPAQSGQQVSVNKKYIDVFKTDDRGEDYSAPYYYNLPRGTIDYVQSVSGNNYELQSGRKVRQKDVTVIAGSGSQGNNVISGVNISVDSLFTTVSVNQTWNVPFNVETSPFSYTSGNWVGSYTPTKVVLTFDYTTGIRADGVSIPAGGAFTNAKFSTRVQNGMAQGVIELTLSQPGKYYGCYAEYTSSGNLKLRFYNPLKGLSGARIVLDPGHGNNGADPGSVSGGVKEATLNLQKAKALQTELQNRGATVYMLNSDTENLTDLYKRCNLAVDWEPHIYVSMHHNASPTNSAARGVEVYYNTPFSMPLARNLTNSIYQAYLKFPYSDGAKNRGHKFSEFAVTRQKQFASVLIENGFITNAQEREVLKDPNNLYTFAWYTAEGLESYFEGN